MRNVLLAYDGSDGAKRALDSVVALHHRGDVVTIVSAAEGLPLFGYARDSALAWLVGSVSTKVLHHAHCSVLVAR